jgi:hypothetical protein
VFFAKELSASSVVRQREGYTKPGLMDTPLRYLIRNPEKEAETYTPEWIKHPIVVGW